MRITLVYSWMYKRQGINTQHLEKYTSKTLFIHINSFIEKLEQ